MSGHPTLGEFQQSLAARLRDAAAGTAPDSTLGLGAGGGNWLLRLEDAGEILPLPDLAAVPLSQPWYMGLANVRGNLVSVIDFSQFITGTPTMRDAECRVVLIADRYRCHAGLLVQKLLGLKDPGKMTKVDQRSPEIVWYGPRRRDNVGGEWQELNVSALVKAPEFLAAGL